MKSINPCSNPPYQPLPLPLTPLSPPLFLNPLKVKDLAHGALQLLVRRVASLAGDPPVIVADNICTSHLTDMGRPNAL